MNKRKITNLNKVKFIPFDKYGKPKIKLHNNALKYLKKITKSDDCSIEVSLSDEKKYAIANVIIYEKEKR